ncbi:hypothetical protein [Colwellia piezophila]|uniref:hypothetical protein n=1 Tax=Colwellia piezophila TaxID=211668 RepID=UPI00037EAFD2|nr:hypothetical protein [Colwellia piezophila]
MGLNQIYRLILLSSLMIFLSSSSFFISEYLTKQLSDQSYREGQFTYALKYHHVTALTIALSAVEKGSNDWLVLSRELGSSDKDAAFTLGQWYWQQALHQQNSPQQVREALTNSAIMWFGQAIRLTSQQAVIALAQLYFNQGELRQAQLSLAQLSYPILDNRLAESALILRVKIAIYQGELVLVKQLLNSDTFKLYGRLKVEKLRAEVMKYGVIASDKSRQNNKRNQVNINVDFSNHASFASPSSCITSLQLFATNLTHLQHIERLISTFKAQQPSIAHYICLPTPLYISVKQLDCITDDELAITCDETTWQSIAEKVKTRHIGLMLEKGGANVHLGILYFDINDNADVFSHEISHLLGFVDEYPLRKSHETCKAAQKKPFSHNIAVLNRYYVGNRPSVRASILNNVPWAASINTSTPILQEADKGNRANNKWLLGTPIDYIEQVGLHLAETCQNSIPTKTSQSSDLALGYSAFKPISRRTQLKYFTEKFPQEYLTILENKPTAYLMPSFHYNIALALYQQGDINQAKHWLKQAARWEDEPLRKLRVLQGGI